ncbi:glycosyltransferase family A protein [Leucobacter sp. NPDC077196]|uniref:glycosyltransferase family 2 protein n=1 Tax=Leucobacter sp. NPDC077196 TaxID=3154959 RepID=UPI0034433D59
MVISSLRRTLHRLLTRSTRPVEHSEPIADIASLTERAYRSTAQRPALDLFKLGTRMFSFDALEQLARYGTREELGWAELEAWFGDPQPGDIPEHWDLAHIWAAALLFTVIDFSEASLGTAANALRRALDHPRAAEALADTRLRLFAFQVPLFLDDFDLFDRLSSTLDAPEDVAWVARVDRLRSEFAPGALPTPDSAWWRGFSEPFVESGVEPWRFDTEIEYDHASWFDRIHAPVVTECDIAPDKQPLVTVIVPAYNPGRSLINTIESLSRQSWRNLEVLLIDDASPEGGDVIERAAALDPRVRLIRLDQNSGAYHARNTGLQEAAGEFVTVLDADDQAHPRRIERQIAPLLADPELMATASHAIRVHGDGRLLTYGATALRRNASSLLFRRGPVLDALGLYDRVYKAADTEYILRMQLRFGKSAVKHMTDALGLIQLTENSLSRGDFRNGWWSGRRVAYRHQYFTWHRLALGSADADFSVTEPGASGGTTRRRFAAPRTFLKQPELERLGVAMLADWSRRVEQPEEWTQQLRNAADESLIGPGPIGLLHGVDQRRSAANRDFIVSRELWQTVEDGRASWISWDQPVRVDTLVVMAPDALVLLPSREASALIVKRVIVLAERRPVDPWLSNRVQRAFGVAPEWVQPSTLPRVLRRSSGADA